MSQLFPNIQQPGRGGSCTGPSLHGHMGMGRRGERGSGLDHRHRPTPERHSDRTDCRTDQGAGQGSEARVASGLSGPHDAADCRNPPRAEADGQLLSPLRPHRFALFEAGAGCCFLRAGWGLH